MRLVYTLQDSDNVRLRVRSFLPYSIPVAIKFDTSVVGFEYERDTYMKDVCIVLFSSIDGDMSYITVCMKPVSVDLM